MNRRQQIRDLYGFDFPEDLFRFWEFANRLRPLEPWNAFFDLFEFQLVGPFDALGGRFDNRSLPYPASLHWRFYNDPPELFTLLVGGEAGLHWGYYFDAPPDGTRCVASYYAEDEMDLTIEGHDIFDAVRFHLEETYRDTLELREENPVGIDAELARLDAFRDKLLVWATADRTEVGGAYADKYRNRPLPRDTLLVARTMDGMGVVADAKQYRPLSLDDERLWESLWDDVPPDTLIAEAERALAEGSPATALKLAKDMWATGSEVYTDAVARLMGAAYSALGRDGLGKVMRAHLQGRDRPWLDILQVEE